MKSIKQLKAEATRKEHVRVYNNFNLPPQDIRLEHDGQIHIRRAWQSVRSFGWSKWQKIS